MNPKALKTLELPKVLDRLANHTSFSAGRELALELEPSSKLRHIQDWVQEVTEARKLLDEKSEQFTLGGVFDVRGAALSTVRGIILEAQVLLDIRSTLRRATTIRRMLSRMKYNYPLLASIAEALEECTALQHEISRIIGEDGKVQDSASPKLAMLRRDMKITFDRLQTKLNSILHNPTNAPYLQEQLITQRNGRYVIPIKADFKGRIPGIIHDQSASGATLWIEPLKTVEANNEFRELQLQEEKEIRRILRELCDLVAHESDFIVRTVNGLAYLDLVFAKAHYANALRATAPKLVTFREDAPYPHPGVTVKLVQARHPLIDPQKVVALDLEFDPDTYVLVITGPNTGGKTVALKTVGLMILMAQCGMHIPAGEGSTFSIFEEVYADIGDEQSIEQSLSTFSSHMTNIIGILGKADEHSLVILDELGAGTDPVEGSALARAILNKLQGMGITTMVTSHHPELKIYAHERKNVRNASVEFNLETLAPTYRLVVGLPGRSNALAIATRLGLPEDIIEEARGMVGTEDLVADDLLDEITRTREETRLAYERAAYLESDADTLRRRLLEERDAIEAERRDVLVDARRRAEYELEELRKEIRRLKRDMQAASQPLEALKNLEKHAGRLELNVDVPVAPEKEVDDEVQRLRLGDTVWVKPLQTEGQIIEMSAEDAEVAIGSLRLRTKLHELEIRKSENKEKLVKKQKQVKENKSSAGDPMPALGKSPGLELDLRGARVEDALKKTDDYLHAAYMANLPFVRIIHGKGTGALRQAIRDILRGNPLVVKYADGEEKEGGYGVTVVNLVEHY